MSNTDNQMVNAISKLNIEGNIIPTTWYKFFTFDNGKPDLIAIHILSDIVYWYRPTIKRCEETGQVIGVYKKFKADLLQRSYDSFAEWLGVSKRQVKEAMDRLEKKGVIFREFRSISASIHNVLFIGINVDILATSLLHSNVPPPTFERTTPYVQTHTPLHSNVPPPTFERKTNTEITTENTTKITTESEYAPTHESEQTHFADEKNSQGTSDNKQTGKTSSAKKSTTAKKYLTADDLVNLGVDNQVANDYLATRKTKLTQTAVNGIIKQASLAGLTLAQAIEFATEQGWQSFKAEWYNNRQQPTKPTWQPPQPQPAHNNQTTFDEHGNIITAGASYANHQANYQPNNQPVKRNSQAEYELIREQRHRDLRAMGYDI